MQAWHMRSVTLDVSGARLPASTPRGSVVVRRRGGSAPYPVSLGTLTLPRRTRRRISGRRAGSSRLTISSGSTRRAGRSRRAWHARSAGDTIGQNNEQWRGCRGRPPFSVKVDARGQGAGLRGGTSLPGAPGSGDGWLGVARGIRYAGGQWAPGSSTPRPRPHWALPPAPRRSSRTPSSARWARAPSRCDRRRERIRGRRPQPSASPRSRIASRGGLCRGALDRNHNRAFYSSAGNYIGLSGSAADRFEVSTVMAASFSRRSIWISSGHTDEPARFHCPTVSTPSRKLYFTGTSMATPPSPDWRRCSCSRGFTSPAAMRSGAREVRDRPRCCRQRRRNWIRRDQRTRRAARTGAGGT